jgi:hypothetical protein
MAKARKTKVTGVKASSIAMFEGTFGALIGLSVAILYSLAGTIELASSTSSVLTGLVFGMAAGVVAIIVVPLVYFAIGYVVGYVHGFIFNAVAGASGGIELELED